MMMSGMSHIKMHVNVPSIVCKACVDPVEKAFSAINGIDSISINIDDKDVACRYNLQELLKSTKAQIHPAKANISVTVDLNPILAQINKELDEVGHEHGILRSAELLDNGKVQTIETVDDTTTVSTPNTNCSIKQAQKPLFSDVLMKHPAMKNLQAATMILMIPMIPIMLSAIYIELTRPLKKPVEMPGM